MIHKVKGRYVLVSKKTGHILGTHKHLWQAKAQETAISLSKARAAGHRIPRRPAKRR